MSTHLELFHAKKELGLLYIHIYIFCELSKVFGMLLYIKNFYLIVILGYIKYFHFFYRPLMAIDQMSGVFANGLGDQGSIPSWVIQKTLKMVIYAILLNTQHYKVWIKGKVEQSREWSSTLPYN